MGDLQDAPGLSEEHNLVNRKHRQRARKKRTRLVPEVFLKECIELGAHPLELLLGRTELEAGVDRVGRKQRLVRSNLPLLKGLGLPLKVRI